GCLVSRTRRHGQEPSRPSDRASRDLARSQGDLPETHILLEELAEATLDGTRRRYMESISTVALLIIDDFGMRKLPQTAAQDLLEIAMRLYERTSRRLTSNRPAVDWGRRLSAGAGVRAS